MISTPKRTAVHPLERRIILKHADDPTYDASIACYERHGGYAELRKAIGELTPEAICQEVMDSQVRGRGGAGFPAGMKWKFLDRKSGKPIYLICNADESEPGTFKDRQIIHKDPHQVIEGMMISALEGKRAYPRIKPPYFPAALGLYMCPTVVNNVETLCNVKHIVAMGGKAYAEIGRPGNTGTRIWCLSGMVRNPGYYELENGRHTYGDLIHKMGGGLLEGRYLQAVIPGGSSAKVWRAGERFTGKLKNGEAFDWGIEDVPLDFDGPMAAGSMSGSGAVIVIDNTVDIVEVLANINAFYAHESCGQCTPCREGSLWMKKITTRMANGGARKEDADLLASIGDQIAGRTICAHGEACAWPTQSFVAKFRDKFEAKAEADPEALRTRAFRMV
jgi:NADH:ubiquinone oxidoreductase subunit F (NADH-binding)